MNLYKWFSTRGLKGGANLYVGLIFDVNSAHFHNHGGYEFANQLTAAQEENKSLRAVAENDNCVCRAYGLERVEVIVEMVGKQKK